MPKQDRFGLWEKIENLVLEILMALIEAGWTPRQQKLPWLETARLKVETAKHLIRIANECKIIEDTLYLELQNQLQEISKMANGWLRYTKTQKEP